MAGGGKSVEFDPQTADPSTRSRARLRDEKQKVAKGGKDLPAGAGKISYGRRFAQTEELYQARVMEKELEALAREDGALPAKGDEGARGRKPAAAKKAVKKGAAQKEVALGSRHQVLEYVSRGAPIGAVPPAREPPPRDALSDLLGDARRYLALLRSGMRDARTASYRLARLPLDVMTAAIARLRPRTA